MDNSGGLGRFLDLGLKTGGATGAARWRKWRTCGAIVKIVSRQSKIMKAVCPSDILQNIGLFCLFVGVYHSY